jgi:hypothetical protein
MEGKGVTYVWLHASHSIDGLDAEPSCRRLQRENTTKNRLQIQQVRGNDLSVVAATASSAVWVCFFEFEALVLGKQGGGRVLRYKRLGKITVAVGAQLVDLEGR